MKLANKVLESLEKMKEMAPQVDFDKDDLPLGKPYNVSREQLNRSYIKYGTIDNVSIYIKESYGLVYFIAGEYSDEDTFIVMVTIDAKSKIEPLPINLSNKIYQITYVNVIEGYENKLLTKRVYEYIATYSSLVSDKFQYWNAHKLWKSLARDSNVNIYVYSSIINDYFKDSNKKIINYNSKNINDSEIWGTPPRYKKIVLVATTKDLNNE